MGERRTSNFLFLEHNLIPHTIVVLLLNNIIIIMSNSKPVKEALSAETLTWLNQFVPSTLKDEDGYDYTRKQLPRLSSCGKYFSAYYNCTYFRKK
jgi:hypothetical protein